MIRGMDCVGSGRREGIVSRVVAGRVVTNFVFPCCCCAAVLCCWQEGKLHERRPYSLSDASSTIYSDSTETRNQLF